MTAKQRKAEQEAFDRAIERVGRTTREEWLARLDAYAKEEDDPPWMTLNPKYKSVFMSKNEQNGAGTKHAE